MTEEVPADAIALLKADHRKVEDLFEAFDDARRSDRKARLVHQIVTELKIHMILEEEIFYPAVRAKIDPSKVDEGYVEHDGAKVLMNDLATAKPGERFYDEKVKVLQEDIKHHVGEEERWITGIFAEARRAGVDMAALGATLAARKAELEAQAAGKKGLPPAKSATLKLVKA